MSLKDKPQHSSLSARLLFSLLLVCTTFTAPLLLATGSYFSVLSAEGRAKLVTPKTSHNFGQVFAGDKLAVSFPLNNQGSEPLQIINTVPACGCIVVQPVRTILPGETAELKLEFNTSGFAGKTEKSVMLITNDLDQPRTNLLLSAQIKPIAELSPNRFFVPEVAPGDLAKLPAQKFTVRVNQPGVKINSVRASSKNFQVTTENLTDQQATFSVKLINFALRSRLRDRIIINLEGSAELTHLNLPVFIDLQKQIAVKPEVVSFGLISEQSKILEKQVRLVNSTEVLIKGLYIKSRSKLLKTRIEEVKQGKEFLLTVTLNPQSLMETFDSEIVLIAEEGLNQPLVIPVFGVLPPGNN